MAVVTALQHHRRHSAPSSSSPSSPPPTKSSSPQQQHSSQTTVKHQDPVRALKYRRRAQGLPTTTVINSVPNHPVVSQMKRLVKLLQHKLLPDLHDLYAQALLATDGIDDNGWVRGVRKITGGRYEIKVLGEYCTTSLRELGFESSLPQAMVDYAEAQARRDERVQAIMLMMTMRAAGTLSGGGQQEQQQLTFAAWSIIVSQQCEAQTIHTDVPVDNIQFGLILNHDDDDHDGGDDDDGDGGGGGGDGDGDGDDSPRIRGTPGTKVVLREDFGPHTVDELLSTLWAEAPAVLKECLWDHRHPAHKWTNQILDIFGPMLQSVDTLEANMAGAEVLKECGCGCGCETYDEYEYEYESSHHHHHQHQPEEEEPLPLELEPTNAPKKRKSCNCCCSTTTTTTTPYLQCGDLICTSGGVPHAGPACNEFRMVMFGAASPTPNGLYDVDDQFFAHSALLYIIQAVWDFIMDDTPSKAFLLQRLAWVAQDYHPSIVDKHESTSPLLTDFMNVILEETAGSSTSTSDIVNDFLQRHGHKTQAELFEHCPPGLQAAMAAAAAEEEEES